MYVVTCNSLGILGKFSPVIWIRDESDNWKDSFFNTYELAFEYACKYLNEYSRMIEGKNLLNNPIDYSGYGDFIQIEQL